MHLSRLKAELPVPSYHLDTGMALHRLALGGLVRQQTTALVAVCSDHKQNITSGTWQGPLPASLPLRVQKPILGCPCRVFGPLNTQPTQPGFCTWVLLRRANLNGSRRGAHRAAQGAFSFSMSHRVTCERRASHRDDLSKIVESRDCLPSCRVMLAWFLNWQGSQDTFRSA